MRKEFPFDRVNENIFGRFWYGSHGFGRRISAGIYSNRIYLFQNRSKKSQVFLRNFFGIFESIINSCLFLQLLVQNAMIAVYLLTASLRYICKIYDARKT